MNKESSIGNRLLKVLFVFQKVQALSVLLFIHNIEQHSGRAEEHNKKIPLFLDKGNAVKKG